MVFLLRVIWTPIEHTKKEMKPKPARATYQLMYKERMTPPAIEKKPSRTGPRL